jgi:hypothetical protein
LERREQRIGEEMDGGKKKAVFTTMARRHDFRGQAVIASESFLSERGNLHEGPGLLRRNKRSSL